MKARRVWTALALLVLVFSTMADAGVPDHPAVTVGPVPAWVHPWSIAEPSDRSEASADSPSTRYLAVDYQIRLEGGSADEYSETVLRVESQAGLEDASQFEVTFDPSFATVALHHLRVFRDGAWHDRIDDAFVTIAQREADFSWRIYDGSVSILLVLDDIRVGDIVSLAYTTAGTNPVFGEAYFQEMSMGWSTPVDWRSLRVLCPPGSTLAFKGFGDFETEPSIREVGGWTEYKWERIGIPTFDSEGWLPKDWDAYPWLQLTQYGSWREVVEWARPLYSLPDRPSAELRQAAAAIGAPGDDRDARIREMIRWVQDEVRYFGIELGTFSHEPHPPDETVDRRYGDCKDKSLLLIALLGEIGVEAWPVLIDTSGGAAMPRRLPSPGVFNHVIVLASIDGNELWIDPTLSLQGGPLSELWVPDYGWGLVIRDGEAGLTELPATQTVLGAIEAEYLYDFEEDGSSSAVVITTTHSGRQAETMRAHLADSTIEELQESYARYYSAGNARAVPSAELVFTDEREDNRLSITETYRLEDWWYREEGDEYFDLLPLLMGNVLYTSDDLDRRAPLHLPSPVRYHEKITVSPPSNWDLEPVSASVENSWFSYTIDGRWTGATLHLEYRFETTGTDVEVSDIPRYNTAIDTMDEDLYYSIYRAGEEQVVAALLPGLKMAPVWATMSLAFAAAFSIVLSLYWVLRETRFL